MRARLEELESFVLSKVSADSTTTYTCLSTSHTASLALLLL